MTDRQVQEDSTVSQVQAERLWHDALKQHVDGLLAQAGLDTSQRLSLLVSLMEELLPREDSDEHA